MLKQGSWISQSKQRRCTTALRTCTQLFQKPMACVKLHFPPLVCNRAGSYFTGCNQSYFMKLRNTIFYASLVVTAVIAAASCTKNETSNGTARMQVSLTDAPGDFEAVLIDVQDVKINSTTDTSGGWTSLENVRRGTYNLLDLVNGKDTLLSDATIPAGRVQQIRLVLGNENYVKVDGRLLKLETPSAQQSGLKLNIHQDMTEGGTYQLLLDFDVAKSIHETSNGKYVLKPTIRAVLQAMGGSIKGIVAPDSVQTAVLAIQDLDTVASTFTSHGQYMLKGLATGHYDLHFIPADTLFKKEIKNSVDVTAGTVTAVDTVRLN